MFIRGETYKNWKARELEEECYTQEVENGCHIEVRAREADDGDIEVFTSVYTATGERVEERIKKLPGEEWSVHDALMRAVDNAERVAGGESGRLPCADAHIHADE